MKRVLIAGCGYVGTKVAEYLAKQGYQVWGLRRSNLGTQESVYQPIVANVLEKQSLSSLPDEIDVLVYAVSADSRSEQDYQAAYVKGAENLLSTVLDNQKYEPRVVFVSSTGVYGESNGEWVDENTVAVPATLTGRVLLAGEEIVCRLCPSASILRLGGIYGPGRRRLIERVAAGGLSIDPDYPIYSNRIHRDDCAGAIVHLIELESASRVYIGVDNKPTSQAEVYSFLGERLSAPKVNSVTWTEEERRLKGRGKRCRNTILVESGYHFKYPSFREGYGEMLSET